MERTYLEDLEWALTTLRDRRAKYQLCTDYYRGNHRQVFDIASESFQRYFRELLVRVRENLCKPVVRAFSERIAIEGWKGANAKAAEQMAQDRKLSALANRVHTEAIKVGDSYILVWPDQPEGERRLFRQNATEMCTMADPEDPERLYLAAKVWQKGRVLRANLYYEDRVERYAATTRSGSTPKASAFTEYADDGSEAVIAHSFGRVPVVRFANDAECEAMPGTPLLEDAIPLQDMLNKTLADLLIADEFFALPMRIFTGVTDEVNPTTGRTMAEDFNPRRDRNLFFGGTETKATELGAGDLEQVIAVTDAFALKIARVTGTPLHYLVLGEGDFPSGEALRTAEARLVSKVTDLHDEWGPVWADVMALLGVEGVEPDWLDPAHITEAERLERLEARKRLGEPWAYTMQELGYAETDIPKLQEAREAERQAAGTAFAAAFEASE